MKNYEIFGVKIKDYPLKEALKNTRAFFKEPGVYSITYVSRDMLLSVAEYQSQRKWLNAVDLMLINEPLEASDENHKFLVRLGHDGKTDDYLENFFGMTSAAKNSIYLISDTDENLKLFEGKIKSINSKSKLVGKRIFEAEKIETLFNDINCSEADIVLSCLPWNIQGPVMIEAKRMLGISVWMGFLPDFIKGRKKGINSIKSWWIELVDHIKYSLRARKYLATKK